MVVKEVFKKSFWPVFVIVFIIVTVIIAKTVYNLISNPEVVMDFDKTDVSSSIKNIIKTNAATPTAVRNLKSDWEEEIIYQHDIVFGHRLTKDKKGNVLILSKGNNKILALSKEGKFSEYLDVNDLPFIQTIAYQPGHDRLLILENKLYAYANGELTSLNRLSGDAGVLEVSESDDTIYTCSPNRNTKINHYDADGNFISEIVDNVGGCSQLALDEVNNKLYYTETYHGQITEIDLSDNSKKVIATNVGIPGTFEPISVGIDEKNTLYSFPASYGLFKYQDGSFEKVVDSIAGAGVILWSETHSSFLQVNGAGANLISYNPTTRKAEHLTQYVNAMAIIETDDGTVLICDGHYFDDIQKVDSSGFSTYIGDIGGTCQHLEQDSNANIYAGTSEGQIMKVQDNSVAPFSSFDKPLTSLSFDSKNEAMIAVVGSPDRMIAEIWRIPINDPSAKVKVSELSNVRVQGSVPCATVDDSGNIFVLERKANVIYKIVDGQAIVFAKNVLEHEAITVPKIEYISKENALLVSTIENYEIWPIDNPVKSTFARNTGAVDNFAINENKDGDIVAIHSGEVFKFVYSP
jgi:hypothetical protein|tara:strand:+ start:1088 stop:2821 length:1734 start_codon:yes stop_codon:yes gene_type:complete